MKNRKFYSLITFVSILICLLFVIPPVKAAAWTANWIWQTADGPANTWISLRKKVTLNTKPTSAITQIAAENMYWLYVNGQLAVKEGGLNCRPDLTNTYYDEIDIANYLQSGENTIALLVWYKGGNDGYTQRMAAKGGLLFESTLTGATPSKIVSDGTWKLKVNPAFKATTQQQQWSAWKWVAWPISYDARTEMANWHLSAFDDSTWSNAAQKGVPPVSPWNDLKPRTIPQWKDFGLTSYQNQSSFPASIASNTTVTGIVGNNLQGSQYIKVNAPAGVKIKMYMNEFYYVEYFTKAGTQEFDTMVWTNASNNTDEGANTHWAKYEFSNFTSTVQILDMKFHQTSYNTEIIGTFSSNDAALNTLWTKCKNTSFVCMRDIFYDCPNRERSQWWGDVSEQILYSFYLYDNAANLLAKKGFRELLNTQKTDGSLYTTAPGTVFHLPDQNMAAVGAMWDYYLYTGDSALLSELYPKVKKYIQYLAGTRNSDGMLLMQGNGEWNWIDWGGNMDIQAGSANTIVNALFIKLLDAVKGMANVTGNTADVSYYQGLQDPVKNNFNTYFWNASSNAYVFHRKDGVQSAVIDDRSNAWAALAGRVDSSRRDGVINVLTGRNDCGPYQERYVEDALFALGADAQAVNRMRQRHASMITSGAQTLWEEFPASNSNNHAWSAGPLYLMDAFMLGIRPSTGGYSKFKFLPQLGDITSLSATIPSVKGNIVASISKTGSQYTQNLTTPANTVAVVGIPVNTFAAQGKVIGSIKVNGTTIWQNGSYSGGVSGISINGSDTKYVSFNANAGAWSFVAAPNLSATPSPVPGTGPAGYTWCAAEGQSFTLPGTSDVAYGAGTNFYYQYGVSGTIIFNNDAFGDDPIPNVVKAGYYKSAVATPTPTASYTPTATASASATTVPTATATPTPTATGLTDITNLGGTISAQYSDSPAGEEIAKLIDNSSSTKYLTFHASGWVQFQAAAPYAVTGYSITSANDAAERDPLTWTFQGSADGSAWTTLDSRTGEDFPNRLQAKSYSFGNTAAFAYYRLNMTNNSGTILQLAEWEIFGTSGSVSTSTPTRTATPTVTVTATPTIPATPTPTAAGTSYNDAFNDNALATAWTTYNGTWSESGTILRQDSTAQGDPCKAILNNSGMSFGGNQTILAKVYVDTWTDGDSARAGVSLFTGTGDGKGYNLLFHNNHSTVQWLDDGTAWGSSYTFAWTSQTWYWFKVKMENGILSGKIWQDGAAEPAAWPYTWTRSGRSGFPALNGGTSGHGGSVTVFFDDVTVTSP